MVLRNRAILTLGLIVGLSLPAGGATLPSAWPYPGGEPVRATHGMVSSISPAASRIGLGVLRSGGNAIDAAVAMAFALAVVWPEAGNLGGGGFMVARDAAGHAYALDYREMAPSRASHDMFLGPDGQLIAGLSLHSRLGVGVPGTVRGLYEAHRRLGKRAWAGLIQPAIRLARQGFLVDAALASSLARGQADLRRDPEASRIFLRGGQPLKRGDRLVQRDLAQTLQLVAEKGPAGFYRGSVARAIAQDMARSSALITEQDLAGYQAKWREPLIFSYRRYQVISMPPPSSGGVLLGEMLQMLALDRLKTLPYHSVPMIHLIAEVERRAFADRNAYLGDPDFIANPLRRLLHPSYLFVRHESIDMNRATPAFSTQPGLGEHPETTHFVVADQAGNVVSNTYTLNGAFGCGVVAPGTGVLYNDEMDDFAAKPGTPNLFGLVQGERNAIAPHKRMLSSMSPTIVLDPRQRFFMALGSPGGSTIPTTTMQVMINVLDYGMNVREAVSAPRFHHQGLPDEIVVEDHGFDPQVLAALQAMGHPIATRSLGDAHAIMVAPDGQFEGWADPRHGGLALGY